MAEPREQIRTSEDVVVSKVGRELYEKFFRNYTRKQWGIDPSELDKSVTARVPTRTNRDDRYFTDTYQAMPLHGFTHMFEKMLAHPNIKIMLNTDYREIQGVIPYKQMIYTGPVDGFFDYRYGKLPYRSLDFKHETLNEPVHQPQAVINYPNEHLYTRMTEFKYLTGQEHSKTSLVYEYPKAEGDPYYPVPRPENAELYKKYKALADATPNVHFVGRLATYKYYNMDQVVAQALTLYAQLNERPTWHPQEEKIAAKAIAPDTAGNRTPNTPSEGLTLTNFATSTVPEQRKNQTVSLFHHLKIVNMSSEQVLPLELWGGIECTVNRVGDQYFDQLKRNGHDVRIEDLDRFAALGIQAIRYLVLWERTAPNGLEHADWSWADQRLTYLKDIGIRPIVGLVHHGSGPRNTSLLDPAFPEKLAEFAHAVAQRYPWVEYYTPVNEPLTTARFSGLYGHWYPHGQDELSFIKALLNQCRAVVLSMQAIRKVNSSAKLVQTEDLGKVFSTPLVAYQADFENDRRWLSFDLLCGHVNSSHPLWGYLLYIGVEKAELQWFQDNPYLPDIIGINRYVCSDRFIDERIDRYPEHTHGGNGKHRYADVEAVWVCADGICDHIALFKEAWERYQQPIAITEAHLGCTREEQLRWLKEIWQTAQVLQNEGINIRAVTAWSLLGSYDWNSLVTRVDNFYEPGAFDVRSSQPRSTAIAAMLQSFTTGQEYNHPLLDLPGWWRRSRRLLYPPVSYIEESKRWSDSDTVTMSRTPEMRQVKGNHSVLPSTPPLLITGATGTLGQAFARLCEVRGIPYYLLSRQEMNITNSAAVEQVLDEVKPWAVINAAGYVRVDDAEREPHLCYQINADGAAILADACAQRDVGLLSFSSDLVFDGDHHQPYLESDRISPLSVYGHSKAQAERWILHRHPCALVIRTSAFFGPWDEHNFLTIALRTLKKGSVFVAAEDAIVSPTYVPDLVNASLDLLIDGECGLWHLANPGAMAWAELARWTAKLAGLNASSIQSCPTKALSLVAPRPTYSVLGSERGILLPGLHQAIARYLQECDRF